MTTSSIPKKITDICPSCSPIEYTKTTCTFVEQTDDVSDEYLYQCDQCSARLWVDYQWAIRNAYESSK